MKIKKNKHFNSLAVNLGQSEEVTTRAILRNFNRDGLIGYNYNYQEIEISALNIIETYISSPNVELIEEIINNIINIIIHEDN